MSQAPAPPSADPVSKQELDTLAAFLFNLIESQITRADTKAGLVIAADSVFMTAALFFIRPGAILKVFDGATSFLDRGISVLMILMFGSLVLSTLYGLIAARPTLQVKEGGETLFFFGRISQYALRDFTELYAQQSPAELRAAILIEVYNTARIANRKFARIRHSIDFLILAVIFYTLVQVLNALTPE